MRLKRFIAAVTAVAAFTCAMPFTVFADEQPQEPYEVSEENYEEILTEDESDSEIPGEEAEEVSADATAEDIQENSEETDVEVVSDSESTENEDDDSGIAEEIIETENLDEETIVADEVMSEEELSIELDDQVSGVSLDDSEEIDDGLTTAAEPKAYVVISRDEKTLTFYYGTGYSTTRADYYLVPEEMGHNADSSLIFPEWVKLTTINSVEIDGSFRYYHPTDISGYFAISTLTSITGLENLDTSRVQKMESTFAYVKISSLDVSMLDVSSCVTMVSMFEECQAVNIQLGTWNAKKVMDMSNMFKDCTQLTSLDLSNVSTQNLNHMYQMFACCESLETVSFGTSFDTSNVITMYYLFQGCFKLVSLDLSNFNTSNTTDMYGMFYFCTSLTSLDLSGFDTSKVMLMGSMFYGCIALDSLNVSSFNTEKVELMSRMFYGCWALTSLDLSSFDTTSVVDMDCMFYQCSTLKTIYVSDNFVITSACTRSDKLFTEDSALIGGNGTTYSSDKVDGTYAVIDSASRPGYFTRGFATTGIEGFVTRCYKVALGRNPDITGYNGWVNSLKNKSLCGSQVAYGFIFSPEYTRRNRSNTDYVTDLYNMFFGRTPSAGEASNWINVLNAGVQTREQVFAGFANSQEFYNLCNRYSVIAGYYICGIDYNKQGKINAFVARLYESCLGRLPDMDGQKNWVSNILLGGVSASTAVRSFLLSPELSNKHLSNEAFVTVAYQAFFGRTPDAAGLRNWVNALNNGMSREQMFSGFKDSPEFVNLCASYGINP